MAERCDVATPAMLQHVAEHVAAAHAMHVHSVVGVAALKQCGMNMAAAVCTTPCRSLTPCLMSFVLFVCLHMHACIEILLTCSTVLLLQVGQASEFEPRFVALEHRGGAEDDPPVVLVGKVSVTCHIFLTCTIKCISLLCPPAHLSFFPLLQGITFDTGGLNLKPTNFIETMHYDMGGAAAVLGAMSAIGRLGVKRNVIGVLGLAENAIGARAYKPMDILKSHKVCWNSVLVDVLLLSFGFSFFSSSFCFLDNL